MSGERTRQQLDSRTTAGGTCKEADTLQGPGTRLELAQAEPGHFTTNLEMHVHVKMYAPCEAVGFLKKL